jgi:hypothetical protein
LGLGAQTRASALQCDPETPRAIPEGQFAAFEDVAHQGADRLFIEAARLVADRRQPTGTRRTHFRDDDLVRVRVDDENGVVRDYDDLPASLGRLKRRNQLVVDRLRVQILGLVDDERPVVVIVERKIPEDANNSARAGRDLADVSVPS